MGPRKWPLSILAQLRELPADVAGMPIYSRDLPTGWLAIFRGGWELELRADRWRPGKKIRSGSGLVIIQAFGPNLRT